MWSDIDPAQAPEWLRQHVGSEVLDVRTPAEFARDHIPGARLVPIDELGDRLDEIDPSRPLLIVCEHGIRSAIACEVLSDRLTAPLANLRGGMARWRARGSADQAQDDNHGNSAPR